MKQARLIGVKQQWPTELLQITPQQLHVLLGGIVPLEPLKQPTRCVVDHGDQVQIFSAPFQPVVMAGVLARGEEAWHTLSGDKVGLTSSLMVSTISPNRLRRWRQQ